jgi:hypothetical protein
VFYMERKSLVFLDMPKSKHYLPTVGRHVEILGSVGPL